MAAGIYDFKLEQGATFSRIITYKRSDGSPFPLTGYTARMQIRKPNGTLIIELTTENGRITLGGSAGTVTLTIASTDTAALDFSAGKYDLELISSGGTVTRLLEGAVAFSREVTK